jgi:uncharacterized protein
VAAEAAIATVDHSDIRGSRPHNRDHGRRGRTPGVPKRYVLCRGTRQRQAWKYVGPALRPAPRGSREGRERASSTTTGLVAEEGRSVASPTGRLGQVEALEEDGNRLTEGDIMKRKASGRATGPLDPLYRAAKARARRGDFKGAVALWRQGADAGHVGAQRELGRCYEFGIGGRRNPKAAFRCYQLAAEAGDSEAQYEMAVALTTGMGSRRDHSAANEWLRKALEGRIPEAAHLLGLNLRYGRGVSKDTRQGFLLERVAARAGVSTAQYALALCYERGAGVGQNGRAARYWFRRAAGLGHPWAMYRHGQWLVQRRGDERALREATKLLGAAAKAGVPGAEVELRKLRSSLPKGKRARHP